MLIAQVVAIIIQQQEVKIYFLSIIIMVSSRSLIKHRLFLLLSELHNVPGLFSKLQSGNHHNTVEMVCVLIRVCELATQQMLVAFILPSGLFSET